MKKFSVTQVGAVAFGALLLASAGAATASAAPVDESDVDLNVEVSDRYPSGVLALSVASSSEDLVEVDSGDPLVREFVGELPTVTVTDTRSVVPADPWAVLGTASDFVGAEGTISAANLGWSPFLLDDYGPDIEPGADIESALDDPGSEGLGYADGELLYVNWDQMSSYSQGVWSAGADLVLKVDTASVAAGSYTSLLTLSLFE